MSDSLKDAIADEPGPRTAELSALADRRVRHADRRMADAEELVELASAQMAVAARTSADARVAEREYRRAIWHYTQLMQHRIRNPLQAIIGISETLLDMPDLEPSRRRALIEAIAQQARVLCDVSLEPRPIAPAERDLRPAPLDEIVKLRGARGARPAADASRRPPTLVGEADAT